jgi:hypothetical protein
LTFRSGMRPALPAAFKAPLASFGNRLRPPAYCLAADLQTARHFTLVETFPKQAPPFQTCPLQGFEILSVSRTARACLADSLFRALRNGVCGCDEICIGECQGLPNHNRLDADQRQQPQG